MKRLFCMILSGLMLFGVACTVTPASPEPVTPPTDAPTDVPGDVEEPTAAPTDTPADVEAPTAAPIDMPVEPIYTSYADFANALSAKLIDGSSNRNLSPISVYLALAMATDGANGQTLNELLSVLGCRTLEELRGVCGAMLEALSIDEDGSTLDLHDSLWMANEIEGQPVTFRDSYLSSLADVYRSEANTVEFGTTSASEQIAAWITEHTRGKIEISPDALNFDASTVAVLINTIYLKDAWAESFNEESIKPDLFHGLGRDFTVDYLCRRDHNVRITKGDGFLRYQLYLRNVGSMVFVLPDEGTPLSDLLGSPEKIDALLHGGETINADVDVMLPKFKFQDKMELAGILAAMGLDTAFSGGADFSGICDRSCRFDRVIQESYIGVDENGVEAAAYTMISMRTTSILTQQLPLMEFHLTRPFLYAIESYDGTLLFIGTVTEPTSAD